jgi:hypothetical protein
VKQFASKIICSHHSIIPIFQFDSMPYAPCSLLQAAS